MDEADIEALLDDAERYKPNTEITTDASYLIYEKAAELWRTYFSEDWVPTSRKNHNCAANKCKMSNLMINYAVVQVAKLQDSNSKKRTRDHEFRITSGETHDEILIHLCVNIFRNGKDLPKKCNGLISDHSFFHSDQSAKWMREQNIYVSGNVCSGQKTDAYICESTGLVHICNWELCEFKDDTEDHVRNGAIICRLTGNVLENIVSVDKFWRPGSVVSSAGGGNMSMKEISAAKRILSNSSDVRFNGGIPVNWSDVLEDIQENLLTEMCNIEDIRSYFNRRKPRKTNPDELAKEYYATALLRVASLFCKTRFMLDLEAAKEARRLANRSVHKILCKSKTSIDAISLRSVQKIGIDARAVPINVLLSGNSRRNFFVMYATRCLKMWLIIRTKTKKGIDEPSLFPFVDFVFTIMYVFREGIKISKTVTGTSHAEIILIPDPMLKMILPRYDDIEKLDGDRTAIMNIRNDINAAITESIKTGFARPQDFYPDSMCIETASLSLYTSLRKHRDKSSKNN